MDAEEQDDNALNKDFTDHVQNAFPGLFESGNWNTEPWMEENQSPYHGEGFRDKNDADLFRALQASLGEIQTPSHDSAFRLEESSSSVTAAGGESSAKEPWSLNDNPLTKPFTTPARRKRGIASAAAETSNKQPKIDDSTTIHSTTPASSASTMDLQNPNPRPFGSYSTEPLFTGGIVAKTWVQGSSDGNDVKIEEVLQSSFLKVALLSSYKWDDKWLLSKIDPRKTAMTLVMDEGLHRLAQELHQAYPMIGISAPGGIGGLMHAKIMLLFYETYARAVVSTADLIPSDWGEDGKMENTVFFIDLPCLPPELVNNPPRNRQELRGMISEHGQLTHFFASLYSFCVYLGVKPEIVGNLCRYDFRNTKDMAFIFSAGTCPENRHNCPDPAYRGVSGLASEVQRLGLNFADNLRIDYISSSLVGTLEGLLLGTLYKACQGENIDNDIALGNQSIKTVIESNFKVYFPSEKTVAGSKSNADPPDKIFLRTSEWQQSSLRAVLHDCESTRHGVLMHNKVSTKMWAALPCMR